MPDINNKIAYIIAVVNEFSTRFSLNPQQAYRYLDRFKGIDFVDEFYGVEHTQSFEDVVDDLAQYCVWNTHSHLRTWLMTWHNTAIRMEVH